MFVPMIWIRWTDVTQTIVCRNTHCYDVIMGAMPSQITSLTVVYSAVYSDADQRKHQSFASLAFVQGIHRWPVNSPHKWPVTRKMFPLDDVIMKWRCIVVHVMHHAVMTSLMSSPFQKVKWLFLSNSIGINIVIICDSRCTFLAHPNFSFG